MYLISITYPHFRVHGVAGVLGAHVTNHVEVVCKLALQLVFAALMDRSFVQVLNQHRHRHVTVNLALTLVEWTVLGIHGENGPTVPFLVEVELNIDTGEAMGPKPEVKLVTDLTLTLPLVIRVLALSIAYGVPGLRGQNVLYLVEVEYNRDSELQFQEILLEQIVVCYRGKMYKI